MKSLYKRSLRQRPAAPADAFLADSRPKAAIREISSPPRSGWGGAFIGAEKPEAAGDGPKRAGSRAGLMAAGANKAAAGSSTRSEAMTTAAKVLFMPSRYRPMPKAWLMPVTRRFPGG